jgi:hypothetical protein
VGERDARDSLALTPTSDPAEGRLVVKFDDIGFTREYRCDHISSLHDHAISTAHRKLSSWNLEGNNMPRIK